jgi:hypothetical protein
MERESSKHGPRRDDQLAREDRDLTSTAQPAHTEEWRQPEPFDRGHDRRPAEQTPGAPAGMTASDVNERSDIAIYLPPGKLPASRSVILDYLRDTGAPDYAIAAVSRLPGDREFATIGEVVREIGIPTEAARDAGSQPGAPRPAG